MFSGFSNYQSLENANYDQNQIANCRNVVQDAMPQNSRNSRKLADDGSNPNFGNNGLQYGSYMNFQENALFGRKDRNQKVYEKNSDLKSSNHGNLDFEKHFQNHFSNEIYNSHQDQGRDNQFDLRKGINSVPNEIINAPRTANYMFEHNMHYQYDMNKNLGLGIPSNSNQQYDRNGDVNGMGQRRRCAGVVQSGFQGDMTNQYLFQNFETLNKVAEKEEEINRFMERNPVNTRHDDVKKERLLDKKGFMSMQGGVMNNFNDLTPKNTRIDSKLSMQSNYIPNGRTMAQPRDLF
jgi:hypothetical protein